MHKALLISILAATMLIAFFAARARTLRGAVRRSLVATTVFCVAYWLALTFVYPSLGSASKSQGSGAAGAP